ncbi:unnamed protein product [Brugia timori]|uniref:Uncharacterized protein n=1 Tax=Brugia timori TaxID=42155 RepID=A0A3P7UE14_9BILA|nr:unnamed protein product [Brugia timori]
MEAVFWSQTNLLLSKHYDWRCRYLSFKKKKSELGRKLVFTCKKLGVSSSVVSFKVLSLSLSIYEYYVAHYFLNRLITSGYECYNSKS